ncbi:MAG: DUF4132 domain-containing protein, partial [Bacteroidota bacterium]
MTNSKTYQELKKKSPREKVGLLFEVIDYFTQARKNFQINVYYQKDDRYQTQCVVDSLINLLLKQKLEFEEAELIQLFDTMMTSISSKYYAQYPIGVAFKQVEKFAQQNGLSDNLRDYFQQMEQRSELSRNTYYGPDLKRLKLKIRQLINEYAEGGAVMAFQLSEEDGFGKLVNEQLQQLSERERNNWYQLFQMAVMVSGGKPTKKFLKAAKPLVDAIGKKFKPQIWQWLLMVSTKKEEEITHTYEYNGQTHQYTSYSFLETKNVNLLKGLVWTLVHFHDKKTLDLLARLTERSFKKIPGIGPAAAALGNACIYVLAQSKGLVGVSHLSRLKLKIQQNNTRKLIQKYVTEQSEKMGISAAEIEDLAVPDYGLVDGKKVWLFEEYQLVVEIVAIGKVTTTWLKPDGKVQKSNPAFIKQSKKLSDKLKAAKAEVKLIQKYLTAQRDRIDRNYIQNRTWTYEAFKEHYLEHGLMNFITTGLIWNLQMDGQPVAAIYRDQNWQTVDGQFVEEEEIINSISLWHPVEATTEVVLKWRDQLVTWQIKQPFKQAYREVYLLTDAEINTRLYSNRMAAHILKQHQFNALAGLRGWKYSLMGAYDDGRYDETAKIELPAYGLSAEFWISEINEDEAWNDAGIWHYITTDQVRFKNANDTVNLIDVPKLVFSEIMRDVDMFVGVASVGND